MRGSPFDGHETKREGMSPLSLFGAGGGGRTRTVSLPLDFESSTSANSITPAYYPNNSGIISQCCPKINTFFIFMLWYNNSCRNDNLYAGVMELADVLDSKSSGSDTVSVRPRSPAPKKAKPKDLMPSALLFIFPSCL